MVRDVAEMALEESRLMVLFREMILERQRLLIREAACLRGWDGVMVGVAARVMSARLALAVAGLIALLQPVGCARRAPAAPDATAAPVVIMALSTETPTRSPTETPTKTRDTPLPRQPTATATSTFTCAMADGAMPSVDVTATPTGTLEAQARVTLTVRAKLFSQADRRAADAEPSYYEEVDPATGATHRCPANVWVDTELGDTLPASLWISVPAGLRAVWAVPPWDRLETPTRGLQRQIAAWPVELVADREAEFQLVLVPTAPTCLSLSIDAGITTASLTDYLSGTLDGLYYYGDTGLSLVIGEPGRRGWIDDRYAPWPSDICTPTPTPTRLPPATPLPLP